MFRFGSLVMTLLLIGPVVRDCCLPVIHPATCHEKPYMYMDDVACSSSQQVVAEAEGRFAGMSSPEYQNPQPEFATPAIPGQVLSSPGAVTSDHPPSDIYLCTGALLI